LPAHAGTQLAVDLPHIPFNGREFDEKFLGNFSIRAAGDDQIQVDFRLSQ
jgi:hypothetical protein